MEHHLVAGIQQRTKSDVERLADADGDENFILGPVTDIEILFNVTVDGAAQFDEAEVRSVMRFAFFERVNGGFADVPGGVEIRFADAERNHVLHLRDDFKKVADA